MSPTVFREGKYRFYFFSKEETKIHIHVIAPDGEAKYWLEPIISLADYTGFSKKQLNFLQKTVEGRKNEIIEKWKEYFKTGNN
jgi:predicted HicB family RNase H-like nuclease